MQRVRAREQAVALVVETVDAQRFDLRSVCCYEPPRQHALSINFIAKNCAEVNPHTTISANNSPGIDRTGSIEVTSD